MSERAYHLLIVDDSPEDVTTYRRLITCVTPPESYQFTVADSIDEAVRLCRETVFDCILLDYVLPDGDGLALLEQLTPADGPLLIPVVVLTGQGDERVAVRAMKSGAQDYLVKSHLTSESLHRAMHHAMEKVALLRRIEEQRLELTRLATLDELTGLYNRRFLLQRLHEEIARAKRYSSPLSLFLCDADHFKAVNDQHGHMVGDEVLGQLAEVFRNTVRRTDVAARYGGEEFCALLPETDLAGAVQVAERLRAAIEALSVPLASGQSLRITCSIGVAEFPLDATEPQGLLLIADQRLYRAKATGRNRVCGREPDSSQPHG